MKMPVSGERFALLQHNYDEARKLYHANEAIFRAASETWKALFEMERMRFDRLLEKYDALKLRGGERISPTDAKPDPVIDAIKERANGNPRLERHLMREAAKLRMKDPNTPASEVIKHVTEWFDPSEADATA